MALLNKSFFDVFMYLNSVVNKITIFYKTKKKLLIIVFCTMKGQFIVK